MAVKRISINWVAKLDDSKDLPKYGDSDDGKFSKKFRQGRFVIPAPLEVDALMRKVPKGKLTTINELHAALSKKHKTDFACPITTGIFSWIAAHAADEVARQGPLTHHGVLARSQERRPGQPQVPRQHRGHPRNARSRGSHGHLKRNRFLCEDSERKTVDPQLK